MAEPVFPFRTSNGVPGRLCEKSGRGLKQLDISEVRPWSLMTGERLVAL